MSCFVLFVACKSYMGLVNTWHIVQSLFDKLNNHIFMSASTLHSYANVCGYTALRAECHPCFRPKLAMICHFYSQTPI